MMTSPLLVERCSVLKCFAVCCSVLQCVLQCVAVYYIMIDVDIRQQRAVATRNSPILQHTATHCNTLQQRVEIAHFHVCTVKRDPSKILKKERGKKKTCCESE